MSRRNLILFILAGFLWGIPYLFIRVAVDSDNGFSPALVVFGRVFIGALILIPISIYDKSFFTAIKGWKYIAVYALFEMVGPWILIGTAEQKISSGLAGLLVSSVPIFSTLIASWHGDKSVWQPRRIVGIVIGFLGVFLLVGIESFTGSSDPLSILMILAASLGYAFITASAIAKVVNVATNVGAILVFGLNGAVIWQIGIILGVANISGAIVGSRLAIKGGSTLVRKVFLVVTLALIIKVGIETF